jgi:hypothetical protein
MQIEKYTDRLKTLVQSAQDLALRSGHQQITPLHLLKGLLDDEDRLAANLIEASGGGAAILAKMLLSDAIVDGETVRVTVAEGKLAINGSKLAQAA